MEPEHSTLELTEPSPGAVGAPALASGRYELLEVVGEGGMGVVHRARDRAFDRDVAVKQLRATSAADSRAARRFLVEARITGRLQHPGIPPVYELGTSADGRPFLAMKFVEGRTLRDLLRERKTPADEIGRFVAVFEQICHAVGYAHLHRVIHRDLKPANVMVGAHGEVQVMDWGLAKVLGDEPGSHGSSADPLATTDPEIAEDAREHDGSHTKTGSVLGTPAYMPPEQASGDVRRLDARSDVFGLGAILCDLLTGRPPWSGTHSHEIRLKAIQGDLSEAVARLDACSGEPELAALCRRCLSTSPDDRPQDGRAVAQVVAEIRQAAEERARKAELDRERDRIRAIEQNKRRQLGMRAAAVVVAALVLGMAGTSIGLVRATAAADLERKANAAAQMETAAAEKAREAESAAKVEAQKARDAESKAKVLAEAAASREKVARTQAEKRLAQVEKGVKLLADVFTGINPDKERNGGEPVYVQLRRNAEKAVDDLDGAGVADPVAGARLQRFLGAALRGLGSYEKAVAVLEKARKVEEPLLGAEHFETVDTLHCLAAAYADVGRHSDSIQLYDRVRAARLKSLGSDHRLTLAASNNLADAYKTVGRQAEAIRLLEQVRAAYERTWGRDALETLICSNNLSTAYLAVGRTKDAFRLLESTTKGLEQKLGATHVDTLAAQANLALALQRTAKFEEAVRIFEKVRELQTTKLGADHPSTLATSSSLGLAYCELGDAKRAVPILEKACSGCMKTFGESHATTLNCFINLGAALSDSGRLQDAIRTDERSRDMAMKFLGPEHLTTLNVQNNLANAYLDADKAREAAAILEKVLPARTRILGAEHPSTLTSTNNLSRAYWGIGRRAESLKLLEGLLKVQRRTLPADHLSTIQTMASLAYVYEQSSRRKEAIDLYEQAARSVEKQGFRFKIAETIVPDAVDLYFLEGRYAEAEAWQRKWLAHVRKKSGPGSLDSANALDVLSVLLMKQSRWTDAETPLRECLTVRRKLGDAGGVLRTSLRLADSLLVQKKFTDAEPMLLKVWEDARKEKNASSAGMKELALEASKRLEFLCKVAGRAEEAGKWRKEIEAAGKK